MRAQAINNSAMTPMNIKAIILGLASCAFFSSIAGQISEPGTVFYGRIVHVSAGHEYLLTEGNLVWTFRSAVQGGREYSFSAKLEPLAAGQFSYRLDIPHEALAYTLTPSDGAVPLTGAGTLVESLRMSLDGYPLTLVGEETGSFVAQQASRAATYRLDLQVGSGLPDSDGDGVPDWWEDRNGTDKWDPTSFPKPPGEGDGSGTGDGSEGIMTFAKWHDLNFPGLSSDLEAFAGEDTDSDGIKNLLEYAYDLPPAQADENTDPQLPRSVLVDGRLIIEFNKRSNASDLDYRIEKSTDLTVWEESTDMFAETVVEERERQMVRVSAQHNEEVTGESHGYFRVRVYRK